MLGLYMISLIYDVFLLICTPYDTYIRKSKALKSIIITELRLTSVLKSYSMLCIEVGVPESGLYVFRIVMSL